MRFEVRVPADSAQRAARFYVEKLALFDVAAAYGTTGYLLTGRSNGAAGLHINEAPGARVVFALRVPALASFKDLEGVETITDGVRTKVVSDPSGNRIVLFEDPHDGTLRLDLFLRVPAIDNACRFYCDELARFHVAECFTGGDVLLLSNRDPSLGLHLSQTRGGSAELFISSPDCNADHKRLAAAPLASGAALFTGGVMAGAVLEWPAGKTFMLHDPAGNPVNLYEDAMCPAFD